MDRLCSVGARCDRAADFDPGELLEEVEVEPGTSKLAIGDGVHTDRLDLRHGARNRGVFDRSLLGGRDRAVGKLLSGVEHHLGA